MSDMPEGLTEDEQHLYRFCLACDEPSYDGWDITPTETIKILDDLAALRAKLAEAKAEVARLKGKLDAICDAANDEIKDVPEGYYPVVAWSNGEEVVINGDPPREPEDYDEETGHNCDAMGCSTLWHVIHRAPLDGTPYKRAEVSALAKACEKPAERGEEKTHG